MTASGVPDPRRSPLPAGLRAVVFDVGETLVDETAMWTRIAERAVMTPLTVMAMLGSLIERGLDHREVWNELGVDPAVIDPHCEDSPLRLSDLYPDALPCLTAVKAKGYLVGIAGNQPSSVRTQLASLGFTADLIASSAEWGVAKPSREFFSRIIESTGVSPEKILYVGDRIDNDIVPAHAAGMRTAFLRRGPWAHIQCRWPQACPVDMTVESLTQLETALA